MVPFAGYSMPVQYEGILAEHRWTREHAGLFDVSHMGQAAIFGSNHATAARALETLAPGDFEGLAIGRMRYSLLLNDEGGIIDDLMVARSWSTGDDGVLAIVVNAGRKEVDYEHLRARLPSGATLETYERGLLALQGPAAAAVLSRHAPQAAEMPFMTAMGGNVGGIECSITRSGYTGEDGYELSVAAENTDVLARRLLADPEVKPIGLGARDSLRLEAGLPLHGHDLDETTSPVEAGLTFAISKRRRTEGGFPGADRILKELADGTKRLRVGIRPSGRAPVREGAEVIGPDGKVDGIITSGGFGATLNAPVAMGYVAASLAEPGTRIKVRGRRGDEAAEIAALPFVPHRYYRPRS
jgi:aminomethyltransferase